LLDCPKGGKKSSGVLPDKPREVSKMRRFYKLLGIAAIAAVIAIGLAGCSNGNDDDDDGLNNGSIVERDPALFGTWATAWETMTFNSDGSFIFYLGGSSMTPPNATWSTSNGVISLDFTYRDKPNTASYTISNSGKTLTTTNCTSGFLGNSDPSDGPAVYTKVN
jgi:hypothetical protein